MLTIYRRHQKGCEHRSEGRKYRRCRCIIWVDGSLNGRDVRQSLGTRDWQKANEMILRWESEQRVADEQKPEPLTIKESCEKFISDA